MDELVTIVMPVYNAERFLKDSISDIMGQTCPFWELICVDDGSTDRSPEILRYFQQRDKRMKIIRQKNRGAACARNAAMGQASGEYVLFLDADDRFMPELLEKTVGRAKELKTDVLIFDAECFDHHTGQKLQSEWLVKRDRLPDKQTFCFRDFPEDILLFSHSVPWNKLYRTDFLKENKLLFQEVPLEEDVVFVNMSYIKAEKMAFLDEALVRYRQNNTHSLSGAKARQRHPLCVYEAMESLRQRLVEEEVYETVRKSFVNYAAEHFLWNLEMMDRDSFGFLFAKTKKYFTEAIRIEEWEADDFIREDLFDKARRVCRSDEKEYLFFLLREKRRIIENINRDFAGLKEYSDNIKRQLDVMRLKKRWFFENEKVAEGSRVILYGAGEVGRDYFAQFKKEGRYDLVAWVDKNGEKAAGIEGKIEAPERILAYEYDYILIAVSRAETVREIKRYLVGMGVSDSRIVDMFS